MPLTAIAARPDLIQNLKAQYDDGAFATFANQAPPVRMPGIMPFSGLGAATTDAAKNALRQAAIYAALVGYELKAADGAAPTTLATRVANHYLAVAAKYWQGDFRPETVLKDPNFIDSVKAMAPLSKAKGGGGGGFTMSKTTWLIVGAVALGAGYWFFVRRKKRGAYSRGVWTGRAATDSELRQAREAEAAEKRAWDLADEKDAREAREADAARG